MSVAGLSVAVHTLQTLALALLVAVGAIAGGTGEAARRAVSAAPSVRTIVEHLSSKTPPYVATLNVPQLVWPAQSAVADRVNVSIVMWVEGQVRRFAEKARADLAAETDVPASLPQSSLRLSYKVTRLDARVLSVHLVVDAYVRGAAGPSEVPAGLTFSLATGKPYGLAVLFRPGTPYLQTLARLAVTGLENFRPAGAHCYVGPPGPPAKSSAFGAWWLTRTALVLAYRAGQYTAAYCGPPAVPITATALAPLLAPGGPLGV